MQLTIHAKGKHAENLSYFLGKHPDRPFTRETKYGKVEAKFLQYEKNNVIFYITFHPNGLSLVKESDFHQLEDYINDREFSLSSLFLTNIRHSIGYVLNDEKEGIMEKMDMSVSLSPISTRLPDHAILELFEPLGHKVSIEKIESDYSFEVNSGRVISLTLSSQTNVVHLFRQLYVLIPVLDNYKHYDIDSNEAEKLLRFGSQWLEHHPKREFITNRFVGYRKGLANNVFATFEPTEKQTSSEKEIQKKTPLGKLRYSAFADKIRELPIQSVVDMGAGEGRLIELLVQNEQLTDILACEPTVNGLDKMKRLLSILERKKKVSVKPSIIQSSLFYRDERLLHKDALVLCEVIEHIERERVDQVISTTLSYYKPTYFIFSTPNYEYNDIYGLEGAFRHNDHRFELTRNEFRSLVEHHANENNYSFEIIGIGEEDENLGFPTQMAVLKKKG